MVDYLKLLNAYRKSDPSVIFFISRTYDGKLYTYKANRVENALVQGNEVSCVSVMIPEFKQESEVPPLLLREFFGITAQPIPGTKKYSACVNGFKERPLTLNLKQNSSPDKSDGKVIATMEITLPNGFILKNVELVNVHMDVTFNVLDIPDVTKVQVFGCIQKSLVPLELQNGFLSLPSSPGSPDMLLVSESIVITEDMKRRFNPVSLTKQWITGGGSSGGTGKDAPPKLDKSTLAKKLE